MLWMTIVTASVVLFAVWASSVGLTVASISAVLTTTCLIPLALTPQLTAHHVGIAGATPVLRTFTIVVLAVAMLSILRHGVRGVSSAHVLMLAWMGIATASVWVNGPLLQAGLVQLGIGIAAWTAGQYTASARQRPTTERLVCAMLVSIVVIEAAVCSMQVVGIPINSLDAVEVSILGNRVHGTANHPNNLGKLLILLLVLLLPMTESRDPKVAKAALCATVGMFAPLAMAQGRANMAAYLCALVLWTFLTREKSKKSTRRFYVAMATIAGVGASAAILAARFEADPAGGVRGAILEIAHSAIPQHFLTGVGPNNYVAEISSHQGSYIPVHNTFVLLLLETGVVGLILFGAPAMRAILLAARNFRQSPHARAILVTTPGLFAIGWTGWGLLGTSVLPLLMFVFAYTSRRSNILLREPDKQSRSNPAQDHRQNAH